MESTEVFIWGSN